jgi:MFS transporter, PAT family, beta-lactamase induction signal transducer AmpG
MNVASQREPGIPHPIAWTILYLPFGALYGFGSVALTNLASQRGIPISEAALIIASGMMINWLKWLWAPVVDITLTPRAWYVLSAVSSGVGVFAMSAVPLDRQHFPLLIFIVAAANFVSSIVGMAVEAIIAGSIPPHQAGRVSAWFQAGNLGGIGIGGGLGLYMLVHLPEEWMSGAIMGVLFFACCAALVFTPEVPSHHRGRGPWMAVHGVIGDLRTMLRTKGGLQSAILCVLPVGTGAAQGVLTQDAVAKYWGAGSDQVALTQGVLSGVVTAAGCFIGGFLCQRFHPRVAYAGIGLILAVIAVAMGVAPHGPMDYVVWSMIYALGIGLAYAAFTAVVLDAMGPGSGATKYNIFASLSNFPIWWLGLLLGYVAEKGGHRGAPWMLFTEAALGVAGVVVFAMAARTIQKAKD